MLIARTWEDGPDRIDIELGGDARRTEADPWRVRNRTSLPCQSSFHLEASFPDDRPPFRLGGATSCPRSTMCLGTDGSANISTTAVWSVLRMKCSLAPIPSPGSDTSAFNRAFVDSCAERLPLPIISSSCPRFSAIRPRFTWAALARRWSRKYTQPPEPGAP
jgi:hypothetical protein